MAIFFVNSPQVLEHDPAAKVDDLVRLVILVQPAVLLAMGSVQAVLHVPVEAWHCLRTTALDPACGHLEMIYQGAQHCSFSYVFRKQLFEVFFTRM